MRTNMMKPQIGSHMLGVVSNLTDPTAPHYYMFVRREDLDMQMPTHAKTPEVEDFPRGVPRNPDDVMVVEEPLIRR